MLVDTFRKDHEDQGDAVEEVKQDDKPSCVEYPALLRTRWHEYSKKEQQDG